MTRLAKGDLRSLRTKTLDELEGVVSQAPEYGSHLVQTCYRLRSKPIGEFGIEDLRIMIGQQIGLPYLLPIALEQLEQSHWVRGDMYPGDLLKMVALAQFGWAGRPDLAGRFRTVLERALAEIPHLRHNDDEGMPNLDVPGAELAQELAGELYPVLDRLAAG